MPPYVAGCLTCNALVVVLYFLTYFGVGVTSDMGGSDGVVNLSLIDSISSSVICLIHILVTNWSLIAGH